METSPALGSLSPLGAFLSLRWMWMRLSWGETLLCSSKSPKCRTKMLWLDSGSVHIAYFPTERESSDTCHRSLARTWKVVQWSYGGSRHVVWQHKQTLSAWVGSCHPAFAADCSATSTNTQWPVHCSPCVGEVTSRQGCRQAQQTSNKKKKKKESLCVIGLSLDSLQPEAERRMRSQLPGHHLPLSIPWARIEHL